jgi:hypothetical protein
MVRLLMHFVVAIVELGAATPTFIRSSETSHIMANFFVKQLNK